MSSSNKKMQRGLSNRHLQMIALGGAIGTGLFLGSASAIELAGPAIAISYFIGGIIVFCLMRMLGEMCVTEPVSGSFSYFADKYWGKFPGFISGWSYFALWLLISMAELTAIGIYIQFWFPSFPAWISALVTLIAITTINLINVKWFGEIESFMSFLKLAAVIAMILLGAFLVFYHNPSFPDNFNNLWIHNGFMPYGMSGIAKSLVVVMFSFAGIELIGVTAGEVEDPKKTIPKSINQVIYRIIVFYVGAMLILLALYPWTKMSLNGSPFVLIFNEIGIPAAAHILNLVILTAAISVYNSAMYSNSRTLFALAKSNSAPKIFTKLSSSGLPIAGVLFTSTFTLIAVMLNYLIPNKVFESLLSLSVSCIIICWFMISATHYVYRKHHIKLGSLDTIHFKAFLFPYINYICMAFFVYIAIVMFLMGDSMRLSIYLIPVWLLVLYVGYKLIHKKSI